MGTLSVASALNFSHAVSKQRRGGGSLSLAVTRKYTIGVTETSYWQKGRNTLYITMAPQHASESMTRPSVYQPNIWDYCFVESLTSDFLEETYAEQVNRLKKEVRSLIFKEKRLSYKLKLLSEIESLGLAYHFQNEIKDLLSSMSGNGVFKSFQEDLYNTAVAFRLLRNHGIHLSEDLFEGFKDAKGDYKSIFRTNVYALLSLYEASHLALEGEIKLDEARCFTTKRLNDLRMQMEPYLEQKVACALEYPLHWRPTWIEARRYIDKCELSVNMKPLLQLAKLNFNLVQSRHLKELQNTIRWWKEQEISKNLTFARDRLIESFYFAVGCIPKPRFGFAREEITKAAQLVTVIDDIYELHGTLDELELLTSIVRRWDSNSMEELPEHMKKCCSTLFNSVNNIAHKIQVQEKLNPLPFLRKSWEDLLGSYLVEAKWSKTGYMPTLEEYLQNATISIACHIMLLYHLLCSEKRLTEEALECWNNYNDLILSISRIFRLCNDLGTSIEELKREDVAKSIQCYMNDNKVSEAEAREGIKQMIWETWKKVNKNIADNCHPLSQRFVTEAINFARTGYCLYYQGDDYGAPDEESKRKIKSMFFEPLSLEQ